ncbi:phage holin family protein [Nocardioides perillae]|uniref:Putative membrane protein n=1 Tax=Nocardioides perillae TaxID=1119534 RepID=A0A7Y9RP88_9ACTN|nr:phage holin family protein [Nocardioides perillae]NYG54021.1 putative membrane protein [Nocardioides perillae]
MRFLTWLLTHAAALAVATWLLDGIRIVGPRSGTAELQEKLLPLLLVALILGVVTAVVKPVVTFFSIPFIVLTLGLFLLVVNAAMLLLTGWIAEQAGLGFRVDGFRTAVLGAVVITLTTWAVDGLVGRRD